MTKITLFICCVVFSCYTNAQVGIGTVNVDPSAMLHLESTNKGLMVPKLTRAQRDAIVSPEKSLMIYQIDFTVGFYYYNGISWGALEKIGWGLTGNSGTNTTTHSFGTLDASDLVFATNATEAFRIDQSGNIGIRTTTPSSKLHLESTAVSIVLINDGFEDNILAPLTTSGDQNWLIQSTSVNSGSFAVQSGPITGSQTTSLFLPVTIPVAGADITFAMRTSTESSFDSLEFYVNGTLVSDTSGDIAWQNYNYSIVPGSYNLEWRYTKDGSVDVGLDTVFIDDISISIAPTPVLIIEDGNQAVGKILVSDANGVATWQDPVTAGFADLDWAFNSGNLNTDALHHQGNVMIGQTTPTPHNLQVYNGLATGTDVGFGSVEFVTDGNLETRVSDLFTGTTDATQDIGSLTQRWTAVYSSNGVINTSDIRTKEDINPLNYGLNEVLQLEPVSFKWKEERVNDYIIPNNEKEVKLGLIAQDVQKVLPEVVKDFQWKRYEENPNELVKYVAGRLGMSYSELIPVVIKAVQEQELILQNLEANNKLLKQKIAELKAKKKSD